MAAQNLMRALARREETLRAIELLRGEVGAWFEHREHEDQRGQYETQLGVLRELHMEKDSREIESKKWDTLTTAGTTIAQAVAYKFTQGNVAPDAKANILDGALRRFGDGISEEQALALKQIFSQEQLIALHALTTAPADTAEKIRQATAEAEHEAAVEASQQAARAKVDADA